MRGTPEHATARPTTFATLIPLAVARFIRIDPTRRSRFQAMVIESAQRLVAGRRRPSRTAKGRPEKERLSGLYPRTLAWTLRHRFMVSLASIALLVASFSVFGTLPDSTPEAEE